MHSSRSVNEAEPVLVEAKSILDASRDYSSPIRGNLLAMMAENYSSTNLPKSLAYAKEAIGIYCKYPSSIGLMQALYISGVTSSTAGQNEQAAAHLREAISLSKHFNGDPNLDLPRDYAYEAQAENELNRYSDAEEDYRAAFNYALGPQWRPGCRYLGNRIAARDLPSFDVATEAGASVSGKGQERVPED